MSIRSVAELVRIHASEMAGPAVRPHAQERAITAHHLEWARREGLVQGDLAAARHAAIGCGRFAAYTYPDAPLDVAELGADLISWLYLFDDRVGESPDDAGVDALRVRFDGYVAVARTGQMPPETTPFHSALVDLIDRAVRIAARSGDGDDWRARFADSLAAYTDGCAQELRFRRTGIAPNFDEYRRVRSLSVGALPVFDVIELGTGQPLKRSEARGVWLSEARRAASLLCAWVNDVYSFPKESRDGDPLNLVAVLMREFDLDPPGALRAAIDVYNLDLALLEDVSARARGRGISDAADSVIRGLESWVHGNRAWTGSSGRY